MGLSLENMDEKTASRVTELNWAVSLSPNGGDSLVQCSGLGCNLNLNIPGSKRH